MLGQRLKTRLSAFWKTAGRLFGDPLREMFIDLAGLSRSRRILAISGYVGIFGLLVLALILETFGTRLPMVTYSTSEGLKQVPLAAMVVSSLGFVLAWAYLLTGATDSRWFVFLPLFGAFSLQLFTTAPMESDAAGTWLCTAPLFLIFIVVGYILTRRKKRHWLDYPQIELAIWLAGMAFFMALTWFSGQSWEAVAGSFYGSFSFLALASTLFWAVSGLAIVDAAVKVGRHVVALLRRLFSPEVIPPLTMLLVLAHPVAYIFVAVLSSSSSEAVAMGVMSDITLSILLVLVALGLLLFRRWNVRSASLVLALAIVLAMFSLGLGMITGGRDISDPLGLALGELGILSPQSLFVVLVTYSVLGVSASFANVDGKAIPRSGRILISLGATLLMISFTTFFGNIHDATTGQLDDLQEVTDIFFAFGLMGLGLPYLAWVLWKKRDRLVGPEADFEGVRPLLSGVTSASLRKWLAIGLAVALMVLCLACLVLALLAAPASP